MKSAFPYNQYFSEKYQLKNSWLRGFLFLIGVAENPFKQIAEKITTKTVKEAFEEDLVQLNIDFGNAMKKHKHEISGKMQPGLIIPPDMLLEYK
jgi:hypothetical protein